MLCTARRYVVYEKLSDSAYSDGGAVSTSVGDLDGGILRYIAAGYARQAAAEDMPYWLLSVDDDEFVLPIRDFKEGDASRKLDARQRLCEYLSKPESLRFKSIRFRWRRVGSSNISTAPDPSVLNVDQFVRMEAVQDWNRRTRMEGKCAFQLNHPEIDGVRSTQVARNPQLKTPS